MRDWNNDGKVDSGDGFTDYMIFEEITNDSKQEDKVNCSQFGAGDGVTLLGVGVLIFGIVVLISWMV